MWYLNGMTLTLELAPETERSLSRRAARQGRTLSDYLRLLAEAEAQQQRHQEQQVWDRYERRELTHGEAAAQLGLTRAEFLSEMGQYGLSPFQYDAAEVLSEAGLD